MFDQKHFHRTLRKITAVQVFLVKKNFFLVGITRFAFPIFLSLVSLLSVAEEGPLGKCDCGS